jgi:hypothetical protein
MHINDWAAIQTLWDKLTKQLDKVQKVSGALGTPRPYVKILVELEDFLNKTLAGTFVVSSTVILSPSWGGIGVFLAFFGEKGKKKSLGAGRI